ncbi:MAG TPA: patatin-like phospholipase family protein, partial [Bacteroidia bacterium]|nr:patatin-like phospholipase family protein [Bacteroidia bacterium]
DANASWVTLKFSMDSVIHTTFPTSVVSSVPVDFALMENNAGAITKANYNFDSLFVPYRCVASDIESKKSVVFRNGDLARAVRASMAFPFYFSHVAVNGKILFDGGLYNNFPTDVMDADFNPDIIIGVNAAGNDEPYNEENIISQVRMMMTTPTNYNACLDKTIYIEPRTERFGLFDFRNPNPLIETGYQAARAKIDAFKANIKRTSSKEELSERRKTFRSGRPEIVIDKITVKGVSEKQAEYVRRILNPKSQPVSIKEMKENYFRLVSDDNIKSIFPAIHFNAEKNMYDMELTIRREKDLRVQFGGNISSRPISEAFVGTQYNFWGSKSLSFNTGFYFGRLYSAEQVKFRLDVPSRIPYYLESDITFNQWNFYKSSAEVFADNRPLYIVRSDRYYGLNFAVPARSKGKIILSGGYYETDDDYYQTASFTESDTADRTAFTAAIASLSFERNTLNRKQYASSGTYFNTLVRFVNGSESTIPGSTSVDSIKHSDYHRWFMLKVVYDNYYKKRGRIRLGFYNENVFSNQDFFGNYTASVLMAPSFQPLQETQTLFLPNFHAHNYIGAGSRNVISITNNFDLRIEGYIFQPFQIFVQKPDKKTKYGNAFEKRYIILSSGLVYHTPIGPLSLFVNYYDDREKPYTFLFHLGFIIFNRSPLN